jgi:hypothetical protein
LKLSLAISSFSKTLPYFLAQLLADLGICCRSQCGRSRRRDCFYHSTFPFQCLASQTAIFTSATITPAGTFPVENSRLIAYMIAHILSAPKALESIPGPAMRSTCNCMICGVSSYSVKANSAKTTSTALRRSPPRDLSLGASVRWGPWEAANRFKQGATKMEFKEGDTVLAAKVVNKSPVAWLDEGARCWRKWSKAKVLNGPWDGPDGGDWYEFEFRDGSRGTSNMVKAA